MRSVWIRRPWRGAAVLDPGQILFKSCKLFKLDGPCAVRPPEFAKAYQKVFLPNCYQMDSEATPDSAIFLTMIRCCFWEHFGPPNGSNIDRKWWNIDQKPCANSAPSFFLWFGTILGPNTSSKWQRKSMKSSGNYRMFWKLLFALFFLLLYTAFVVKFVRFGSPKGNGIDPKSTSKSNPFLKCF